MSETPTAHWPAWLDGRWRCPYCHERLRPAHACSSCRRGGSDPDGLWDLGPLQNGDSSSPIERAYDRIYEGSGMRERERAARLAPIDAPLLEAASGPALELGCGDGRLLAKLAARGVPAVGLDLSRPALLRALQRGHVVVRGDALCLPFADRTFRTVLAGFGTFAHLDPTRAIQEAARVLAPGGALAFHNFGAVALRVERAGAWSRQLRRLRLPSRRRFHQHPLKSASQLRRLLRSAGFRLESVRLGFRRPGSTHRIWTDDLRWSFTPAMAWAKDVVITARLPPEVATRRG